MRSCCAVVCLFLTVLLCGCGSGFATASGAFSASQVAGTQTVLHAWGNSQTQGYGLPGCSTLTCHPVTAWPAVFAAGMGWSLDNQAYGSSDCADLTYQGTGESMWDLPITAASRNVYGHFRNDQAQYGPLPYRVDFARGCIEAETAWLALPDEAKARAISGFQTRTGDWQAASNSTAAQTSTAGATLTFAMTGTTVYLAAARRISASPASYTVAVDGVPVFDFQSQSTTFSQSLDVGKSTAFPVSEALIPYLIRVPGLENRSHLLTYTCSAPTSSDPCIVFFAASPGAAQSGIVYSLSPVNNARRAQSGYITSEVTSLYVSAWKSTLTDLNADGLKVVGIDATDSAVYSPDTQSQADGVHESVAGHASIAKAAIALAAVAEKR